MPDDTQQPSHSGPRATPYSTLHWRLRAYRGPAKWLKCAHCSERGEDKRASDWARLHELDGESIHDYIPLCRKCHIAYDKSGHRRPHSEETKFLLSVKNSRYRHTPEAVEKIRATSTGRRHTAASRAKMSRLKRLAAIEQGPMPTEQRAKISAGLRRFARSAGIPGNPNIGKTRAAQQRAKTHCAQGHELTPDNIYWRGPDKKNRQCKTCARERSAARYEKQREAAAAARANGTAPPSRRGGARPGTGDPEIGRRSAERQLSKTHCPAGHEYTEENTYVIKRAGGRTARQCKTCTRAKAAARRKAA
jgi:hypothetical protein